MLASTLLLIAASPALPDVQEATGRATVFRVDEVRTLDGKTLKNATVVVREGAIATLGEAAVVPDHARVIDLRGQGSVLTPPLVLSSSGFLVGGSRRGLNGRFTANQSLRLDADWGEELLEEGVLLLGVDPPGTGIPGRTSVLAASSDGEASASAPLVSDLYLKVVMGVGSNKALLRKALEDADKAIDKEEKAREEWKKARAEWEKKQKEKAEAEKKKGEGGGEKGEGGGKEAPPSAAQEEGRGGDRGGRGQQGKQEEEKEPPKEFTPPKMDPDLVPVVEWVRLERPAQVWISSAAEWLHWLDVLGDRELSYELVLDVNRSTNLHEVKQAIADTGLRVHLPAVPPDRLTLPYTRIRLNLAAELAEVGVEKLVLMPPGRSTTDLRAWRTGVAQLVGAGLDRDLALRAMSVEPAASLGQEEKVAPLKPGAQASFVVWSGDPLAPTSEALYVVSEGETVYDRERAEAKKERGGRE